MLVSVQYKCGNKLSWLWYLPRNSVAVSDFTPVNVPGQAGLGHAPKTCPVLPKIALKIVLSLLSLVGAAEIFRKQYQSIDFSWKNPSRFGAIDHSLELLCIDLLSPNRDM